MLHGASLHSLESQLTRSTPSGQPLGAAVAQSAPKSNREHSSSTSPTTLDMDNGIGLDRNGVSAVRWPGSRSRHLCEDTGWQDNRSRVQR